MCANNVFHELVAESNGLLFIVVLFIVKCCTVIKDTFSSICIRKWKYTSIYAIEVQLELLQVGRSTSRVYRV